MSVSRFTVITLPIAEHDIREVAMFIANENPSAAVSFATRLWKEIADLAVLPERFAVVRGVRGPSKTVVRRRLVGDYKIYFVVMQREVIVLRVLHGARRQPKRFPRRP